MSQNRAYGRPPSPTPAGVNWPGLIQVGGVLFVGCLVWQIHKVYVNRLEQWEAVETWMKNHGLLEYRESIVNAGIQNMDDITNFHLAMDEVEAFKSNPPDVNIMIQRAFQIHQDQALLLRWLNDYSLQQYAERLSNEGIHSLDALAHISELKLQKIVGHKARLSEFQTIQDSLQELQSISPNFSQYISKRNTIFNLNTLVSVTLCAIFLCCVYIFKNLNSAFALFQSQQREKRSLFDFVTGHYLAPDGSTVEFEWEDKHVVGHSFHFNIKFYEWNGSSYPISNSDNISVEIWQGSTLLTPTLQLSGVEPQHANRARVTFTVHRAGIYKISVMVAGKHINHSPFEKTFIPGPMDPQKSQLVNQGSVVVGCQGRQLELSVEARDSYDNVCESDMQIDNFKLAMTETEKQVTFEPRVNIRYQKLTKKIQMTLTLDQLGCYHMLITYNGLQLKNSDFHILLLSERELASVDKAVSKRSHNVHFEARLLSTNYHTPSDKGKKIYCYISPKQLTIKEFHFKIIPKKLNAFRVCPSTKFQFLGIHNQLKSPILCIEDGCQPPVLLASLDRNIIAATFSKHLMKNIGGSETFKDKQDFFYHEIRQLHAKRIHDRLSIKINRAKLLENSFKATKTFSTSDWCKNFEIIFQNEEGLDWGGVRREWFEMLCTELFDPNRSGLFVRFKEDDPQALFHPNPLRPPTLKLKYYEFAGKIVGKCLYESALGGGYKQQVKAKFSRSFLAQLIGLRVNYKYFEKDDPDLYTSKIRYIEDNDVDDMELTFTEEEFNQHGKLEKVVDLIPGGSKISVTSTNKMKYLDALAQYKLSNRVQDEIDAFLKGLNELIPDNLLSIFDENELELLMCGTGDYSITDFKNHHTVSGSSSEFLKVLEWFWTIVAGYTREEMARLLQFTTGCSQLPSGGFSQLTPNFQIIAAPTYKVLPTAHTCFNQLCLPDYDSLEEMHQALRLAITEGNQGFGMV